MERKSYLVYSFNQIVGEESLQGNYNSFHDKELMEPITSAVVQNMILATPLSLPAILSLPVIVGGAIVFSGNPFTYSNMPLGTISAFISNLVLAFRNVALKLHTSQQEKASIHIRSLSRSTVIFAVLCAGVYGLAGVFDVIPGHVFYVFNIFALSGFFHVVYSYVSTGIVLLHLSVVSHAVANILKRVLVVLLLYLTGSRSASPLNFLGLAVCTLGLLVYAWSKRNKHAVQLGKMQTNEIHPPSMTHEFTTRARFFLLVVFTFCGSISLSILKDSFISVNPEFLRSVRAFDDVAGSRFERTFTNLAHQRPYSRDLWPDLNGYLAPHNRDIQAFLQEDLLKNINRSSFLSNKLRNPVELIKESQRLHFDVMGKALGKYKYAMLLDIASFENKGDPCITVGEIYFLARINLEIVYYCSAHTCTNKTIYGAAQRARRYSPEELVILVHGGGNIVGYPFSDYQRFKMIHAFKNYQIFVFPQSVYLRKPKSPHLKLCARTYCCNANLTFVMRDHLSYSLAKRHFGGGATKFLLAPDMAFQIGPVSRFLSPVFDILWIRRQDNEAPSYTEIPSPPPGVRLHMSDWWGWITPGAPSSLEKAFYICTNGLFYLQRGRVVITDRLHGHILATLLNIPHVIIDNTARKLSSYHRSWTAGLENAVITDDPSKALDLAMKLLTNYTDSLPPRVPYLHIDEQMIMDRTFSKAERSYT